MQDVQGKNVWLGCALLAKIQGMQIHNRHVRIKSHLYTQVLDTHLQAQAYWNLLFHFFFSLCFSLPEWEGQ